MASLSKPKTTTPTPGDFAQIAFTVLGLFILCALALVTLDIFMVNFNTVETLWGSFWANPLYQIGAGVFVGLVELTIIVTTFFRAAVNDRGKYINENDYAYGTGLVIFMLLALDALPSISGVGILFTITAIITFFVATLILLGVDKIKSFVKSR
jgi:hypothetical protein